MLAACLFNLNSHRQGKTREVHDVPNAPCPAIAVERCRYMYRLVVALGALHWTVGVTFQGQGMPPGQPGDLPCSPVPPEARGTIVPSYARAFVRFATNRSSASSNR